MGQPHRISDATGPDAAILDAVGPEAARAQDAPIAVLGAGIAGLTAADRLSRAGRPVVVIDAADRIGGTHRSVEIGAYTFDVGSIFYEPGARLFDLAPGLDALCPTVRRVQRRVAPDGSLQHYPLEPRDLLRWPAAKRAGAVADLLRARVAVRRDGSLDTICRRRLGDAFYRGTGLRDYIARFNHVPPEEVDETFFFQRMGFIARSTELRALLRMGTRMLRRRAAPRPVRPPLHVRPRAGYDALFAPVRAALEARGVRFALGAAVERVERDAAGRFVVHTAAGPERAGAVIGAAPLDLMHRAALGTGAGLLSLDLMTLFVSAAELHPETGNVLFNFHPDGRWKRATIYSRLYPDPAVERAFFAVEVTVPPGAAPDPEAAFADASAQFEALGLARDLRLEGHALVPGAYPLYLRGQAEAAVAARARVRGAGILPVGRQGGFEYLPTAGGVIRRVDEELARNAPALRVHD